MTKEELEKEAEEFTDSKKSFWRQGRTCIDSVKQAYITAAEPREKRIEELDKEKAEEYKIKHVCNTCTDIVDCNGNCPFALCAEQAFIAGLKAKWHDLREDQNDLPKGHKVVLNQVGESTTYAPDRGFLGFGGCGIIAWTEIPIFNKD